MRTILALYLGISTIGAAIASMESSGAVNDDDRSVRLGYLLSGFVGEGYTVSVTVKGEGGCTVLDGAFTVFAPGGQVVGRGTARDGLLHGQYLSFDISGILRSTVQYSEDVVVGQEVRWDSTGQVSRILHHSDRGQLDGVDQYFRQGVLTHEIVWNEGEVQTMREFKDGSVHTLTAEEVENWRKERFRAKGTKTAQPGATDNPDDAQRLREDH